MYVAWSFVPSPFRFFVWYLFLLMVLFFLYISLVLFCLARLFLFYVWLMLFLSAFCFTLHFTCLNSDGQQFHQYQHNEQSPLTQTSEIYKKKRTINRNRFHTKNLKGEGTKDQATYIPRNWELCQAFHNYNISYSVYVARLVSWDWHEIH
jgi:hypothetical protein